MHPSRLLATLAAALAIAVSAHAFGHEGHQAIGTLARDALTPGARAAVTRLLGSDDLAAVATWLDDVRLAERQKGPLAHDPAALDFIRRFPRSKDWHFVNFPVGSEAYDPASPFAIADDVVHGVTLAIAALEGADNGLTRAEALKVLVHLVGDLHQPLHAVTGYYDLTAPKAPRLLTPAEATPDSPEDAGGNALFYTKDQQLHALWDTGLLQRFAHSREAAALVDACRHRFPQVATTAATPGDYHQWAVAWTSESIRLGAEVFRGLDFGPASVSPGRGRALRLHKITITLPAGYEASHEADDARQVALAGARLAALLNTLHWAP